MTESLRNEIMRICEVMEDEREIVRPTDHFSEAEMVRDRTDTILQKLEESAESLRLLLDAEDIARRPRRTEPIPEGAFHQLMWNRPRTFNEYLNS